MTAFRSIVDAKKFRARRIDGYGSSLMQLGTLYTPLISDRWMSKLAGALGGAQERNYGVGSTSLISAGATSGWPQSWRDTLAFCSPTPDIENLWMRRQMCLLKHAFNDVQQGNKGNEAGFQGTFKECVRAWVNMMRAHYCWDHTSSQLSYGAGWVNQGFNAPYGGSFRSATTPSTITLTLPATNPGGTVCFYFVVQTTERCRQRAKIDGGAYVATLDATALGVTGTSTVMCVQVDSVPAGAHTVAIDFDMITGGARFLGCTLAVQTANYLPLVVVIGSPSTPAMPWNGTSAWTVANKDATNQTMIDTVATWTDGLVRFIDIRPLLENVGGGTGNTIYFADDVHYNVLGNAVICDVVLDEIQKANGVPQIPGSRQDINSGVPLWNSPPGAIAHDPATHAAYVSEGHDNTTKAPIWKQVALNARTATAVTYVATAADDIVAVTDTTAPRTITLPAISAVVAGKTILIKDESGAAATNNITVQRAGSDTIEGATTKVINTNYGFVRLYSTGTVWAVT